MNQQRRTPNQSTWANGQLWQAIRKGLIIKPDVCEQCGARPPSRQLQGHHADHFKPLEVEWLCVRCHSTRPKGPKVFSVSQVGIMVARPIAEVRSAARLLGIGDKDEFTFPEVCNIYCVTE